jgi:hypothetical protein
MDDDHDRQLRIGVTHQRRAPRDRPWLYLTPGATVAGT